MPDPRILPDPHATPDPHAWTSRELDERIGRLLDERIVSSPGPLSRGVAHLLRWVERGERIVERMARALTALQTRLRLGKRPALLQELADHLREDFESRTAAGTEPDEAWRQAVERFGDVDRIVGDLEQVHRQSGWVLLSRLGGLAAGLLFLYRLGLGVSYLRVVVCFLTVALGPALAALWPRAVLGKEPARFLAPRLLFVASLAVGGLWVGVNGFLILAACAIGVLGTSLAEGAGSHRYWRRQSAYCLWGGVLTMGMFWPYLCIYAGSPDMDISEVGRSVAIIFVAPVYALLMGRPSWRWTTVLALPYLGLLAWILAYMGLDLRSGYHMLSGVLTVRSLILLCGGLAVGWGVGSGRAAADWLLAGGLLSAIVGGIMVMCDLSDETVVWSGVGAAMAPLGLTVAVAATIGIGKRLRARLGKADPCIAG